MSEPDDALKCLICLAVARDPWQHGKCGRLFCEKCLNKYGKDKFCPNCRMKNPQYMEDARSKCSYSVVCTRGREGGRHTWGVSWGRERQL